MTENSVTSASTGMMSSAAMLFLFEISQVINEQSEEGPRSRAATSGAVFTWSLDSMASSDSSASSAASVHAIIAAMAITNFTKITILARVRAPSRRYSLNYSFSLSPNNYRYHNTLLLSKSLTSFPPVSFSSGLFSSNFTALSTF